MLALRFIYCQLTFHSHSVRHSTQSARYYAGSSGEVLWGRCSAFPPELPNSLKYPFFSLTTAASLPPKSNSEPQQGKTAFLLPTTTVSCGHCGFSGSKNARCVCQAPIPPLCLCLNACFLPLAFLSFPTSLSRLPSPLF